MSYCDHQGITICLICVSHCTLAINVPKDKTAGAFEYVLESFKPLKAKVEEIGLVEFRPVKHLGSYKLIDRKS